jgi:pimeloyl-ACP methyl ester carboxylesterase
MTQSPTDRHWPLAPPPPPTLPTPKPTPTLLIMLPGLDGTGKLLTNFIRELGDEIECRILPYPTHEPLGYEQLEQRVRAALPEDRPYVLMGESFGGPIAIRVAADRPVNLRGLVLCGTFAASPYPYLKWARPLAFLVPIKSLPRWLRAPLLWGSAAGSRAPPRRERAIAGVAGAVVRRRISALLGVDTRASLQRIVAPVLILYGRHDRIVSARTTWQLIAQLPHAEVAAVEGPHLLLQARAPECAARVAQFLNAVAATAARQPVPPTVSASMRKVGCPTPTGTD